MPRALPETQSGSQTAPYPARAGRCEPEALQFNGGTNTDFCLARYLASGALDMSLNSTGTVITTIGSGNDVARGVALQPDGKIVLAGYCSNGTSIDFCLARYLASGRSGSAN